VTCLALSISGVASAHPIDRHKPGDMPAAPALHMVHYWRDVTWHWQDLDPTAARTPYLWVADGHGVSSAYRWKLAWTWYYRQVAAHKHYEKWQASQPTYAVPTWFYNAMSCISDNEEYGYDGINTSAGKLGFIYSPASYPEPGPTLAAQYGNSWLNIQLSDQLRVAYAVYQANGNHFAGAWSTASACGLS